jgi:3-methyladenine DNA glycosylase AlkC
MRWSGVSSLHVRRLESDTIRNPASKKLLSFKSKIFLGLDDTETGFGLASAFCLMEFFG